MTDLYQWQDDGVKAVDPYEDWLLDTGEGYGYPFGPPSEDHWHTGTEAAAGFVAGDKDPAAIYPKLYKIEGYKPHYRPFVLGHSSVVSGGPTQGGGGPRRRISVPLRAASVNLDYDPEQSVGETTPASSLVGGAPRVVVGVIDDGIAFLNRRFQSALGQSRVDFAWVQDGDTSPGSRVAFGREYPRREIEAALTRHTDALGATNEAALYRDLGLIDSNKIMPNSLDGRIAHGTHVLDLAAGADYKDSEATELDRDRIITVQIPSAVTWDTSGMGLDMFVLSGVHYILDRADQIAPDLPVVINFSYGLFGGPHDGTALLEKAIDELVEARNAKVPTAVVLPAGNHYLDRSHAVIAEGDFSFTEPAGSAVPTGFCDLPWRVQPNDRTSSYLEIWMPKGNYAEGDIEVEVIPPIGEVFASVKFAAVANTATVLKHGTNAIARLSYDRYTPLDGADERGRFTLVLAPTEVRNVGGNGINPLKPAPAGEWKVRLIKTTDKAMPEPVHARIQRDASPFGYPGLGRQSYFDDPAYQVYGREGRLELEDNKSEGKHSIVKRAGSFNGIATGAVPIVVGGHVESTGKPATYSGSKPETSVAPLVSAESDRSLVFGGIKATGVRSGVSVALNGTSVAAPIVTRRVAEIFKAGKSKAADEIKNQAHDIEVVRRDLGHFAERNSTRQGAGRIPKGKIYGS